MMESCTKSQLSKKSYLVLASSKHFSFWNFQVLEILRCFARPAYSVLWRTDPLVQISENHVLGGMLFDLAPGVLSLDAFYGEEYTNAQQIYEQTRKGPYGSPGMLWTFMSYASIVI